MPDQITADTQQLQDAIDWPPYWLVSLERAISAGNYSAAAEAQAQLKRLGVEATIRIVPCREVSANG